MKYAKKNKELFLENDTHNIFCDFHEQIYHLISPWRPNLENQKKEKKIV